MHTVAPVVSDSATPWTVALQAPLWDSPGKDTGVSRHALLQGIFPIPGSNRDRTGISYVSCFGRRVLGTLAPLGGPV